MKLLAALAAAIVLAGCGTGDEGVRVIPLGELPQDLYSSPSPSPTASVERTVRLFFVSDGRLVEVARAAGQTRNAVESALRELLKGPTAAERESGFGTAIPDGAELLEVDVRGRTASVNLSKEFELSAEQKLLELRLGQVVYTVTALQQVDRVRFLFDGEPAQVIAQDGQPHETVGRRDYSRLTRG